MKELRHFFTRFTRVGTKKKTAVRNSFLTEDQYLFMKGSRIKTETFFTRCIEFSGKGHLCISVSVRNGFLVSEVEIHFKVDQRKTIERTEFLVSVFSGITRRAK